MTHKSKFLASSVSKMIQRYNLCNSLEVPDIKFHYSPLQGSAAATGIEKDTQQHGTTLPRAQGI
jgi:hypothetical protein